MKRKVLIYTITPCAIALLLYHAVYFKSLSEVKKNSSVQAFNAGRYAQEFWRDKLIPASNNALDITQWKKLLETKPEETFDKYSHALGIGNLRNFIIKGEGEIKTMNEDEVVLAIASGSTQMLVPVTTEFIYGNTVRDAVGGIDLTSFTNTMDLNNVSAEINKRIRQEIVSPFKKEAKPGSKVRFVGAVEVNQLHLNLERLEIIPVALNIVH